jgi:hypothetical protein
MGFDVVLNVSRAGETQIANFQWSPYGPGNSLPSRVSITLYGGDAVLRWFTNSSGLFLQVSVATLPATYVAISSTYRTQSTSPSTTVTCIQTASAPLYLIVKNDGGAPIPNQPLSIQAHLLEGFAFNTTTNQCEAVRSTHAWINETGPDGKIELGMTGDVFNVTTNYLGRTYQVNAEAEGAESAECVTLSLPSGTVNTTFTSTFTYLC